MNLAFLKRTIAEASLVAMGCSLALFAYGWVRVWIVSRLDMADFREIMESFPEELVKLSPVPMEQLFTYPGRVGMTFEEGIVLFIMILWAVSRGSDCVSGKIASGTMEMLLAQPLRRGEYLLTQWITMVGGTALLAVSLWAGIAVGIQQNETTVSPPPVLGTIPFTNLTIPMKGEGEAETVPMSELVSAWNFLPAVLNLFSLGICVSGLALFASSWDRFRWRTIGMAAVFVVVQFIFEIIAVASEEWATLRFFTIFSAYDPVNSVAFSPEDSSFAWQLIFCDVDGKFLELGPLGNSLFLIGIGMAGFFAGYRIFRSRDLPAPI